MLRHMSSLGTIALPQCYPDGPADCLGELAAIHARMPQDAFGEACRPFARSGRHERRGGAILGQRAAVSWFGEGRP